MPAMEVIPGNLSLACAICSWVIDEVTIVESFLERSSAGGKLTNGKKSGLDDKKAVVRLMSIARFE